MSSMSGGNPFASLPRPVNVDPSSYQREQATKAGYRTYGGDPMAYGNFMGYPTTRSLDTFGMPKQPGLLDQAGWAVQHDAMAGFEAAERQRGRVNEEIGGIRGLTTSAGGQISASVNEAVGGITGMQGRLQGLGASQMADFEKGASGVMTAANRGADAVGRGVDAIQGRLALSDQDISGAYLRADKAEATAAGAVSGYSTGVAEQAINATISGLQNNVRQKMQMIQAGLNPDGTMMSPQERAQAMREMTADVNQQSATILWQGREQMQNTLATLKEHLADVQLAGANVHLEGARERQAGASLALEGEKVRLGAEEFRAGVGETISGQRIQAQEGQRALEQVASGLESLKANLRTSSKLAALNFEMQGRMGIAQLVQENPESVIAMFPAMMAMAQIQSAPNSANLLAINFGNYGGFAA